jgi:hypothetical protein
MPEKKKVGVVTRYFAKIGVAAIMLESKLSVGDKIRIEGTTTGFDQTVDSMQINRVKIKQGDPGQEIAIKVKDRVRENDLVFQIS